MEDRAMGKNRKDDFSSDQIQAALDQANGEIKGAAELLGLPRETLSTWINSGAFEVTRTITKESSDAICVEGSRRKISDQTQEPGTLTDGDLKNHQELLADYDLDESNWELVKVDVSKRDAGTVKAQKIARTISVTVAPKSSVLKPANAGEKTVFKGRPKKKERKDGSKLYVILGDEQAPSGLDEKLHERVCQFLRDVSPDEVVHIGDLGDFESVSTYQQLNPNVWGNTVQDCINSSYEILGNYRANVPKESRFRYLIGNHEVRLQKYLLAQAKELYGIKQAGDGPSVLDLEYLLRLDELNIELVKDDLGTYPHPEIELVPNKLIATHGDVARSKSGSSPHAASERTSYGVIHGHTHRAAVVSRTIQGTRKSYQLQSAEIGCLCTPNGLGYTPKRGTDWQQGFATVTAWDDGHYQIDLASYQNGTLVWRGERWS